MAISRIEKYSRNIIGLMTSRLQERLINCAVAYTVKVSSSDNERTISVKMRETKHETLLRLLGLQIRKEVYTKMQDELKEAKMKQQLTIDNIGMRKDRSFLSYAGALLKDAKKEETKSVRDFFWKIIELNQWLAEQYAFYNYAMKWTKANEGLSPVGVEMLKKYCPEFIQSGEPLSENNDSKKPSTINGFTYSSAMRRGKNSTITFDPGSGGVIQSWDFGYGIFIDKSSGITEDGNSFRFRVTSDYTVLSVKISAKVFWPTHKPQGMSEEVFVISLSSPGDTYRSLSGVISDPELAINKAQLCRRVWSHLMPDGVEKHDLAPVFLMGFETTTERSIGVGGEKGNKSPEIEEVRKRVKTASAAKALAIQELKDVWSTAPKDPREHKAPYNYYLELLLQIELLKDEKFNCSTCCYYKGASGAPTCTALFSNPPGFGKKTSNSNGVKSFNPNDFWCPQWEAFVIQGSTAKAQSELSIEKLISTAQEKADAAYKKWNDEKSKSIPKEITDSSLTLCGFQIHKTHVEEDGTSTK